MWKGTEEKIAVVNLSMAKDLEPNARRDSSLRSE
jgi:hypothetical protein